jgi:GT2 family glycosyltransferase
MNLSIVIVNWNTCDLLAKCLASIFAYPPPGEFEVWVVDNASSDGSINMVSQEYLQVRLIRNSSNLGFARANNQAIRQSIGRYTLLLNPDTELTSVAFQKMVDFMDAAPEAGAAGPRLLNPDGAFQVSCYPSPTLAREFWRLFHLDKITPYGVYPMQRWNQVRPTQVEVVQGACLILRKEALDQVGLLDEEYFIYSEEVDLCYRLKKSGWQIFWLPEAEVVHHGGQSTRLASEEMFLNLYQSKVHFFRKNFGWLHAFSYKLILLLAAMARVSTAPVARIIRFSQGKELQNISDNYRRLLIALPRL